MGPVEAVDAEDELEPAEEGDDGAEGVGVEIRSGSRIPSEGCDRDLRRRLRRLLSSACSSPGLYIQKVRTTSDNHDVPVCLARRKTEKHLRDDILHFIFVLHVGLFACTCTETRPKEKGSELPRFLFKSGSTDLAWYAQFGVFSSPAQLLDDRTQARRQLRQRKGAVKAYTKS